MSSRHDRLELLDRYLRIPTISRQVTPEMIDSVRTLWRGLGLELTPLAPEDRRGTPALYGDAALDELVLVARGGADNKGQHLSNILGAMDAIRSGTACWKVKIILDGEEEHGSPNLEAIARAHRDKLAADVLIGSDGPKQKNAPTLVMGVRGLLTVNLVADNGQQASVHSGNYGNIVPNPVLPLARLIADIEERVRAWSAEHEAFRREASEVFSKWQDKAVWTPFLRPTVNINSFMSDGASLTLRRTIIPRTAHARVDIRLTPDTPVAAMRDIVQRAVADHQSRTQGVTFTVDADGQPASYTSPSRPEFGWLLRLLEEHGGEEPVALPILGGTLPLHVFTDVLGIPCLWIPAANSNNQQHDVNEHYVLRHFYRQTRLYAAIVSSRPM